MNRIFKGVWIRFWMLLAGTGLIGRTASRLAGWAVPPFLGRIRLANLYQKGFIAPTAAVYHPRFRAGRHLFIDDRVLIFDNDSKPGGSVSLGNEVRLCRDSIIETGEGGLITIGDQTFIQPRCQLSAYKGAIRIGRRVQIAAGCAMYSYNHGTESGAPIWDQPLTTRGDIEVGDDAWLGCGVIVLSGVRIGAGAVIGAGSVVTRNVPENAIAVGNPAGVVRMRGEADHPSLRRRAARLRH